MNRLVVLYDGECAVCRRARHWLSRQDPFIKHEFLALQDDAVLERFPEIEAFKLDKELCVISDTGELYIGAAAWIMCLYALKEYQELSTRLATLQLLPLAQKVVHSISSHRYRLSKWLATLDPKILTTKTPKPCTDGCKF